MDTLISSLDISYNPRWWRCRCGRVLGVVMRDASRIRRLWVFRQDRADSEMPSTQEIRDLPKGMFLACGVDVCRGVECSHCGYRTEWISNDITRMIVYYQQRFMNATQSAASL